MTDVIIPSLKVNPEFQTLIPPLTDDEYKRLETSLINNGWEGWRGPILVWDGVIVDGHNRYRICQEHGIAFTTKNMHFSGEDSAKLFIISNQLSRRNLPVAAIGLLKLEEKDIVARQAKERHAANGGDHGNQYTGGKVAAPPNLGEAAIGSKADKHDGETLEILARDIGVGRESLRKLDVIKQKAEEGDPVAIEERAALNSGEKKSIHGAYVRVTGDKKPRSKEEATASDGRKICVMCGEPIDEGDSLPSRPTVHKKCEKEYQRDWKRRKKKQSTENITIGDVNEVIEHDKAELKRHLMLDVSSALSNLQATLDRYESMGVAVTEDESKRIRDAIDPLIEAIQSIAE